jgi:sulfate permease, SulP family
MLLWETDFLVIPIIFYGVVLAAGLNLDSLRASGWLFDVGTSREPWYKFYSYFGTSFPFCLSMLQ